MLMRILRRRTDTKDQSDVLIDFELKQKIRFENMEVQQLILSFSEEILIATHNRNRFSIYRFIEGKNLDLVKAVTLDTESRIFRGALAPDDNHLVVATADGFLHSYRYINIAN